MRALLLLLALAQTPDTTPNGLYRAALEDLAAVRPDKQRVTRYFSLSGVPEADREPFVKALTFALNSTSTRSTLAKPLLVADGRLLRLDLEAVGWDAGSRSQRIEKLEKAGVDFGVKDDAAKRKALVDPWEKIQGDEPFFRVNAHDKDGQFQRGWLDPVAELRVRELTQSSKAVLRADWLLSRMLVEAQFGGYYSLLLMLPPKEADLYKSFGVDIRFVDDINQLKTGGAVLESIVALHNRELQQIPSLFGHDEKFIWRTFDVNKDDIGDKSVLEAFAGTLKLDGREIIGSLPNGLHWYYLSNAKGEQVAVVPPDIAQDKRLGPDPVHDRQVVNSYKCIACHGPAGGTYPFDDAVGKAILDPKIGLLVLAKDKAKIADKTQAIEDYYLSDLGRKIARQNESYAERVKACNGLKTGPNADALVGFVESYTYDLVTPAQAAREMGVHPGDAVTTWRRSGNGQLVVLGSGQAVRRAAWEKSFADAMRANLYPWDQKPQFFQGH